MKKVASVQDYFGAVKEPRYSGGASMNLGRVGISISAKDVEDTAKELWELAKKYPWYAAGAVGAVATATLAPWVQRKVEEAKLNREHEKMVAKLMAQDEMLAYANPEELESSYSSMRNFAPTLAADPNAAKSFLRNAVASGGGVDFNTLKLLAETENAATGRWRRGEDD